MSRSPSSLKPLAAEQIWGGTEILQGDPPCKIHDNVVHLPRYWALYNEDGSLIADSAFRRLGGAEVLGAPNHIDFDRTELTIIDEEVIFGGSFHPHFGHFLCTGLSRIWALDRFRTHKVLFQHMSFAHAKTIGLGKLSFDRLDLTDERMIEPGRPTLFRKMIIPASAFDEQWRAYTAHREVCLKIGEGLSAAGGRPAYLSKTKLGVNVHGGVHKVVNEIEIELALAAAGIDIVYPERLTIEQQIGLFASGRTIMGLAGSAFHVHIFAPASGRLVLLQPMAPMVSNQLLLDRLAGRSSAYLLPSAPTQDLEESAEGFHRSFLLSDTKGISYELALMS